MQVETFEIERTDELNDAAGDGMAQELCEKLGLSGQDRFHKADTLEAIPFRKMTKEESQVYGFLFPEKSTPKEYSEGLIPIRVLQVLEKAKSLNFFTKFVIWYPANADITDPILIGITEVEQGSEMYRYKVDELYILARWGECLEPLEKLKTLAVKKWKETRLSSLQSLITKAKLGIEEINCGVINLEVGEVVACNLTCG